MELEQEIGFQGKMAKQIITKYSTSSRQCERDAQPYHVIIIVEPRDLRVPVRDEHKYESS